MSDEVVKDVAVLQVKTTALEQIASKLDANLSKLTEATISIKEMVALHDKQLEHNRLQSQNLTEVFDEHQIHVDRQFRDQGVKLDDLKNGMYDLRALVSDSKNSLKEEIYAKYDARIKELETVISDNEDDLSTRVEALERFKWIGGIVVAIVAFLVSNADKILLLLK
jgi:chromosome segregation ATPase